MSDEIAELRARVEALRRKLNDRLSGVGHNEDYDDLGEVIEVVERLNDRVNKIERVVDANPERVNYQQMSHDQKVYAVRRKLVEIAQNTDGTAAMTYGEVQTVFSGQPSAGHAYNLMEAAADMEGFGYSEAGEATPGATTGQKRVTVDVASVNAPEVFHRLNNGGTAEGGENHV